MVSRILLDTNIVIIGYRNSNSLEAQVLARLRQQTGVILLLSWALEDQIRRVARRVGGKDWAGIVLHQLWSEYTINYVSLPDEPTVFAETVLPNIPREDILIFLTALEGQATHLISGNREFLRQATVEQRMFRCLTPVEFLGW